MSHALVVLWFCITPEKYILGTCMIIAVTGEGIKADAMLVWRINFRKDIGVLGWGWWRKDYQILVPLSETGPMVLREGFTSGGTKISIYDKAELLYPASSILPCSRSTCACRSQVSPAQSSWVRVGVLWACSVCWHPVTSVLICITLKASNWSWR